MFQIYDNMDYNNTIPKKKGKDICYNIISMSCYLNRKKFKREQIKQAPSPRVLFRGTRKEIELASPSMAKNRSTIKGDIPKNVKHNQTRFLHHDCPLKYGKKSVNY